MGRMPGSASGRVAADDPGRLHHGEREGELQPPQRVELAMRAAAVEPGRETQRRLDPHHDVRQERPRDLEAKVDRELGDDVEEHADRDGQLTEQHEPLLEQLPFLGGVRHASDRAGTCGFSSRRPGATSRQIS